MKLKSKILAVILSSAILPLLVIGAVTVNSMFGIKEISLDSSDLLGKIAARDSKEALLASIKAEMTTLVQNRARLVDARLGEIENQTQMVANVAAHIYAHPNRYAPNPVGYLNPQDQNTLTPFIRTAPGVDINTPAIKSEIALAGNIQDVLRQFAVTGSEVTASYLGLEIGLSIVVGSGATTATARNFDPRTRNWYIIAARKGALSWSDLFEDIDGRGLSISCAAPVYAPDGRLVGVAGSGAVLSEIEDIITSTTIGDTGYAFLLSSAGEIIASLNSDDFTYAENGSKIRKNYLQSDDETLRLLAGQMTAKASGVQQMTLYGRDVHIAYAPLGVIDWSIGLVVPTEEIIEPVANMERGILALQEQASARITDSIRLTLTAFFIVLIAAAIIAAALAILFAYGITRPITALNKAVIRIADGDLDTEIAVNTRDEIAQLGHSVNKMARDIKNYIRNLAQVSAEKERIGAELEIAAHIQASMLPSIFPPYPERKEIDLYGMMCPAKEVGGDFYDFFFIDGNTLAVVAADVSGKGVPAALFMVIAKTLIKNNAQSGKSPAEVFAAVNNTLCWNNQAGMFVTAFMAYLDLKTGGLTYVNAGHNPPFRSREGVYEYMAVKPGFVLGGIEGLKYTEGSAALGKGDILFLYTDGLTEAANRGHAMFGKDRVLDALNSCQSQDVKNLVSQVESAVEAFAGGAEQYDDMTMLALIFKGPF
ncbi:MAG: SpoIIE family protein phosphatase [Desulfarculales bacterium]|jgi:sigma-B regulation protein RsbU (phosphoserine phosphatase)|nr:SpoIIE family protein phosphatase [Desulfarculales bacterium]